MSVKSVGGILGAVIVFVGVGMAAFAQVGQLEGTPRAEPGGRERIAGVAAPQCDDSERHHGTASIPEYDRAEHVPEPVALAAAAH